jgi:Glyoxalase-like domain
MHTIGRRSLIAVVAGAACAPLLTSGATEVPSQLDHILLGCNDLDRGIDFVEQRAGARPAVGGVHPNRGTRNALLSLGERRYLEVIAPDPQQDQNHVEQFAFKTLARLKELSSPHLIGWAAHPSDLEKFSALLRDAGIAFLGPWPGSRQRPDGQLLQWKSLNLKDDQGGLLPFFIEWSGDSIHPSADAPKGCRLARFGAVTPNPAALNKIIDLLQLDMLVSQGDKAALQATIVGPQGELTLTS